jgi:hypothetical protein
MVTWNSTDAQSSLAVFIALNDVKVDETNFYSELKQENTERFKLKIYLFNYEKI